ncbi:MAG: response regulator [Desulfamplus sp.]|nr:response regulator [Desulfamplus sp.]
MTKVFPLHILVTDLNHHVRNLLQRELTKAGCIVYTAGNRKEMYEVLSGSKPIDLIILDPELFEIFGESFFMEFKERMADTTIILHSFSDFLPDIDNQTNIKIVEKSERSIFSLKKIIEELYEK